MEFLALSETARATVIVSAIGGVSLVVLIAFGLWWFRPFRSDSEDVSALDGPDERR